MGSDTGCSVPSVLLFFDRQRFLFNAGEGFQRFCVEHRVKLSKVSGVLATRTTTEATGGLPGACWAHCLGMQGCVCVAGCLAVVGASQERKQLSIAPAWLAIN